MKKLVLSLIVVLLSVCLVSAQEVRVGIGYGLATLSDNQETDTEVSDDGEVEKNENLYYTGGSGINFGVAGGIDIQPGLTALVGIGYVMGSEGDSRLLKVGSAGYDEDKNGFSDYAADEEKKVTLTSSYLPIDITIKATIDAGQVKPYVGFGPTIGLAGKSVMKTTLTEAKIVSEQEITFNMGLGWNATLGVDIEMNEGMSIFAGLVLRAINLTTKDMKYTKLEEDGKDVKDDALEAGEIADVEFKDNVTDKDNEDWEAEDIYYENSMDTSFSSISIVAGVALKF